MNVFDRAIEILNERGWIIGTVSGPNGETCMMGAVEFATSDLDEYRDYEEIIKRVVGPDPVMWNDDPNRSKDEVIEALRKASELVGAQ
jgi:hypothetical protein